MKRLKRWAPDIAIVAGFLLLPFLLFGDVTLGGKTMLPLDNLFQWAPWSSAVAQFGIDVPQNSLLTDLIIENAVWKQFFVESVRAGEIPLWNPYLFAGAPFLATGQHSMLYPASWLFFVMPATAAYGWYTVSQLWLAGVLMWVLGRVFGMRRGSAALAGLVYQGMGFLVVSAAVFPMIIAAAAWLPLLLACIEKIVRGSLARSRMVWPWLVVGSIALGLQILAGHIEITYYTLLIMALFAAWRLLGLGWGVARKGDWISAVRPAAWLLSMVLIGLMLGAVQLVPFYEVGQVNFREGSASFAEVREWAFPERRILTLALPNFFGNPAHHSTVDPFTLEPIGFETNAYGETNPRGATTSDWGLKNYVEGGIYFGILPLVLALFGVVGGWKAADSAQRFGQRLSAFLLHPSSFFAALAFFSLAFIFGTPLYALLYYGLPFINQLHTPFRWVWPLGLCVAVLAGVGIDYVRARRSTLARWLGLGLVVVGVAVLLGLAASWLGYAQLEPTIERVFMSLALAPEAFDSARTFYSYLFWQVGWLGLMLLGSGLVLWLAWRQWRWVLLLALMLIGADVVVANWGFHSAVDAALLEYKPELVTWLEAQPGHWRLTSYDPSGTKPFNANSGWLYNLQDVRGYDSIIPKQYTDYMAAIEPQNDLKFNRVQPIRSWESLNSPLLAVLGVKYVISAETIDLPAYSPVWSGEGVTVYENLAAAPRAYTLPLAASAVVDDPLAALAERDPRQFAVIAAEDWQTQQESVADAGKTLAERWSLSDSAEIESVGSQPPLASSFVPADITEYRNIQVTVDSAVGEPSWLILNDSMFSGWKAFVRPQGLGEEAEVEVPVVRVNGNFRGVVLEPGEWTVRFRYSPASFQLGGLASAMAVIILLFGSAVWGWRQLYNPDSPLSVTRSIAKNSALPMGLNLFNRAIDFVFAMYYLRVLGPADAGRYTTAITMAMLFEIIANYGLDILLIRDVAQKRDDASHYLFNTTVLRLAAGVVAAVPIFVFMAATSLTENPLTSAEVVAVIFIMIGMVFSGMSKGVTGLFYVYEVAEIPAAMTTATTILKVGFGGIVLLLGYSFVGLAAVSIVVNVITLTILAILASRRFELHGPWRIDWELQRLLVRMGFPLMLIHLLQTVFISIDVILLRVMLDNGEEVVGWYQNAYKWFNALQIIPSFFTLALFPIISRAINDNMATARRMYTLSLKLMLLLALPIALATTFLAPFLVRLLAGEQYLPHGAIALQIVIWSIPFGWLNSVTNYVLIALGMERMQPRAFAIAVGFNIVTNMLFIPMFSYVAAGVTTILSELVLMVVFAFYLRQRMDGVSWRKLMLKPMLISAVAFAIMLPLNQVSTLLALVVGGLIYAGGLLLLGVIGAEERQVLGQILPNRIAVRLKLV